MTEKDLKELTAIFVHEFIINLRENPGLADYLFFTGFFDHERRLRTVEVFFN